MINKLIISTALLSAAICCAEAADKTVPSEIISNLPQIRDVIDLPLQGLRAVEAEDGKTFFLSENGRYVISGLLVDAWEKKPLPSIKDMRFNFTHIDLDKIGIKVDYLNPILLGTGSKQVVIFIDPQCHWCHSLLKDISESNSLKNEYTFKIVVIPALGNESNRQAEAIFCTSDDNAKRLNALLDRNIDTLGQTDKSVCQPKYDKLLIAAQMIGITRVPYLIAPDTRFVTGKPDDLQEWLTKGEAQLAFMEQRQKELLKQASDRLRKEALLKEKSKQKGAMREEKAMRREQAKQEKSLRKGFIRGGLTEEDVFGPEALTLEEALPPNAKELPENKTTTGESK